MAQIIPPEPGRPYAIVAAQPGETTPLDVATDQIMQVYRTHGALLLRGFTTGLDDFRRFAEQFCSSSVFNESPDRQLLDDAHNIQSVNGGSVAFPLHPELSREPWKPDACFFCCLTPPRAGGMTTVCDGVALVTALPPKLREALDGRRLLYILPATPEVLEYWLGTAQPDDRLLVNPPAPCPYRFQRTADGIVRYFSRPVFHRPMFTAGPAFGNFLLFARFYSGITGFPVLDRGEVIPDPWLVAIKEAGDRLTAAVAWERGDLLMLDNTRFMHGRTAITDPDNRLIASYFGYLRAAVPDGEETPDAPWRRAAFRPPQPRAAAA